MRLLFLLTISISIISCNLKPSSTSKHSDFKIGIIADCQYCDCETSGTRHYKKSPNRLKTAIENLNKKGLAFTIHLGDFIDRDFKSFDTLSSIWNGLKSTSYHVLGNHDFSVADSLKKNVAEKLNLKSRYYSFNKHQWKFIVLDGNDLSLHGSLTASKKKQAKNMLDKVKSDSLPYAKTYNGGLSREQLTWIKQELEIATKENLHVAFFNHFPARPIDGHNFWNTEEFLNLIKPYGNVKLFLNGHNHGGAYFEENGVHFITFKAMVNTEDTTSYAYAKFTKDSLIIHGYGREENRKLQFKN